ncbi:MAG: ABC transporter ATP-binding protein [Akkermansiaceae bacterium]|nr:ABC transporter ATP-binding protein [Akkermansiaceae bacterium]
MREMASLARQGFKLLTQRGRKVLLAYFIALVALASLDGIALFLISKLFTANSTGQGLGVTSSSNLKMFIAITLLFISRSVLSTFSSWLSLKELANQEVEIGQKRMQAYQEAPLETLLELHETDFFTAVDRAPSSLLHGFLMPILNICVQVITGGVILGVVLVMQPTTAIVAFAYFTLMAVAQHRLLYAAQSRSGKVIYKSANSAYEMLSDYFHLNKLLQISESKTFESVLGKQRSEYALAKARQAFISTIPSHFMESMLAFGFIVVAGFTWWLEGEAAVVPAIVIFAAAGFRLLPIVNRIQGLVLSAVGTEPLARLALTEIPTGSQNYSQMSAGRPTDPSTVMELIGVDFKYPSREAPVLQGINLAFKDGLQYAIVGPSGSGKTTLIDICLGLLSPQKGQVLWKSDETGGCFGYVPQETHISSASIAGNVAMEWDSSAVDLDMVREALNVAHLDEYFDSNLIDEKLHENFSRMSGGQRQRLGLARALYRESKILILDEATSSLDAITESKVMETVKSLRGKTTVVIVAHRLSTIKDADQVIYVEGGKVLGMGTFTELQESLPQFKEQVRLGQLTI